MKIFRVLLPGIAMLAALPAMAAGVDGKWNASVESPMGAMTLSLEFKTEGEKLTGAISTDMGGMAMSNPISDGKVKGDDISFKLSVAMMEGAPPLVIDYKGKVKGDELTLTSTMDMGQGAQEQKMVAKRAAAAAAPPAGPAAK
jgi:hypothetical protein